MPKISEEKRQARRLQILEVATRCFARQGFHRTSMEDIIRELKSSPGAVYCYFRGKTDIVAAIAEQRHNRESALLAELLASGDLSDGLPHLARAFVELLQDPKERERRKVGGELIGRKASVLFGTFLYFQESSAYCVEKFLSHQ